jgi:uncharacterized protein YvpB
VFTNSKIYIIILLSKLISSVAQYATKYGEILNMDIKMDKSRQNLNKLKIYHVSDKEAESYKLNRKNRYLQQYLDNAGKPDKPEKNSVYDPKGLHDFFNQHEHAKYRELQKSRRITLKNNISLKFQAVSLILVFIVMIFGNIMLNVHKMSGYVYDADYIKAEQSTALDPVAPVEFNQQVYDSKYNAYYWTVEALNQNTNAGVIADAAKIRELSVRFNMLYIDQHAAGMPNGCEIASLAMLISRDYKDISVHEIDEHYLDKKPLIYSNGLQFAETDPTYYYIGDPRRTRGGFGIFAPGLTNTANKALQALNINRIAYDISGCSEEELFAYASQDPVIIWYTLNLNPVNWGFATWYLPNNRPYSYPLNLHCAVLVDYDETSVTMYDPTYGVVEYSRELFLQRWNETGPYKDQTRQAVLIR